MIRGPRSTEKSEGSQTDFSRALELSLLIHGNVIASPLQRAEMFYLFRKQWPHQHRTNNWLRYQFLSTRLHAFSNVREGNKFSFRIVENADRIRKNGIFVSADGDPNCVCGRDMETIFQASCEVSFTFCYYRN